MDLLEDFDRARSTLSELGAIGERFESLLSTADDGGAAGPLSPGGGAGGGGYGDAPTLSVEVTARQAARGRGAIVAAACGGEGVLLATARGYLLRYYWDDHGNERVVETELTKSPDVAVRRLFCDPGGSHAVAMLKNTRSGAYETHYMHRSWTKARPLAKLQGLAVSAAGWQRQPRPGGGGGSGGDEAEGDDLDNTTGDLILGTEAGSLHLTRLDQRLPKKEPPPAMLLDWGDRRKAVCAICQEVLPCGARVVLVSTPGALYVTSCRGPGVEGAFARFHSASAWVPLIEVAVPSLHSQLALTRPGGGGGGVPSKFAWLVGGSICHGHLLLERFGSDPSVAEGDPQEYIGDMRQLPLGPPGGGGGGTSPEDEPTCLAVTEFHYLLLHPDRLTAINQVSGKVVAEVSFAQSGSGVLGSPLALLQESGGGAGASYLVTSDALHEVELSNEGRGMWRTYLEYEDYDSALKLAVGPAQRDAVYLAMAQEAFARRDYKTAASRWARVVGGRPSFEEVALQLVEAGDPGALALFLSTKLQVLGRNDKAQSTLVATWLTELLLDSINRAALEAGGNSDDPKYKAAVEQLRSFLTDHVEVLDVGTTTGLLASYGRLEELQHYAAARGDDEALLDYLMQRPDGATRALAVLRKPGVSSELVYKFAPPVVAQATDAAVDFLVSKGPALDPRRLLPALVRFGEPGAPEDKRDAALRYVRFAIEALRCTDSTVHNLAVALLSLSPDEGPLLEYLSRGGRNALGRPLYDAKYALRLARDRDRPRACVKLLSQLGLHQDAVVLALEQVDLDLAKAVAETGPSEDDEQLRRKLWLDIARRVVQEGGDKGDQAEHIASVMALLREAGGLLRIEDVLPLFPDFVTIDAFKAAIVDSLQRYSAQIEDLKREMDEATLIAEAVHSDLRLLSGRTATISARQPCARCGRPVTEPAPNARGLPSGAAVPPFYLFPTGLAFHVLCAAEEVAAFGGAQRAKHVRQLLQRLSRLDAPGGGTAAEASVVAGLETFNGGGAAGGGEAGGAGAAGGGGATGGGAVLASLLAKLEEEVGAEDPWNGELVVRLVDLPFIDPVADAAEAAAWRV